VDLKLEAGPVETSNVTSDVAPKIHVASWPGQAHGLWVRLGIPSLGACMLVLVLNHRSSGLAGAAIALVVAGALVGIELPLILRAQRRAQVGLMAAAPPGMIIAVSATVVGGGQTTRPGRQGTLAIDGSRVTFTAKAAGSQPDGVAWDSVRSLRVRPAPQQPWSALVELSTDHATLRWRARCGRELATAMNRYKTSQG
jgi:hypothetical protein